jgi:hypothetical protein
MFNILEHFKRNDLIGFISGCIIYSSDNISQKAIYNDGLS